MSEANSPKPKKRGIFREAALEKLSTPERLDELIQVTSAKSWIALAGVFLLLGGTFAWSVLGSVTTRVEGQGILLGGDLYNVSPTGSGRIVQMHVAVGDVLAAGQVIAEIDQPTLRRQVEDARARLLALRDEYVRASAFDSRAVLDKQVAQFRRQLAVEKDLLAQGLITGEQQRATEQRLDGLRTEIERERQQQVAASDRITEAERALSAAQAELAERSRIVTPRAGRVVEKLVQAGELSTPGAAIIKLDLTRGDANTLRAVVYVSTADGKRITAGMPIRIAPASIKPEEHGYIVGRVTQVAELPATTEGMMQVLRNDQLVRQMAQTGAPFEVQAELEIDPATVSGYRWTSSGGPGVVIGNGTPCAARVTVLEQRPIELVVPAIRRALKLH